MHVVFAKNIEHQPAFNDRQIQFVGPAEGVAGQQEALRPLRAAVVEPELVGRRAHVAERCSILRSPGFQKCGYRSHLAKIRHRHCVPE